MPVLVIFFGAGHFLIKTWTEMGARVLLLVALLCLALARIGGSSEQWNDLWKPFGKAQKANG